MNHEILGWIATACFLSSYFVDSRMLRIIQGLASGLWIVYGIAIHSKPLIVANSLVVAFALISMFRLSSGRNCELKKQQP